MSEFNENNDAGKSVAEASSAIDAIVDNQNDVKEIEKNLHIINTNLQQISTEKNWGGYAHVLIRSQDAGLIEEKRIQNNFQSLKKEEQNLIKKALSTFKFEIVEKNGKISIAIPDKTEKTSS